MLLVTHTSEGLPSITQFSMGWLNAISTLCQFMIFVTHTPYAAECNSITRHTWMSFSHSNTTKKHSLLKASFINRVNPHIGFPWNPSKPGGFEQALECILVVQFHHCSYLILTNSDELFGILDITLPKHLMLNTSNPWTSCSSPSISAMDLGLHLPIMKCQITYHTSPIIISGCQHLLHHHHHLTNWHL